MRELKNKWSCVSCTRNFTLFKPDRGCLCTWPLPRCCVSSLHPAPSTHVLPSQSASVSIIGRKPWQGKLLSQREKEAKHGLVRNVREQPCSFVHSPASLPAFQSTIQTSESLDKGRLCPPICRLHPAFSCPPSYPSLHPVAPPLPPSFHRRALAPE